ncbi:MAG: GH3 auxin-responsive promoter family protein, partial [Thiovulaceae bacterium]|nr:GH3 auxin-responsive promoter family protein [Sulfurimonadaceae bacterium]
MSIITNIYSLFTHSLLNEIDAARKSPWDKQINVFKSLIESGKETIFGKEHKFDKISSISDFQKEVP